VLDRLRRRWRWRWAAAAAVMRIELRGAAACKWTIWARRTEKIRAFVLEIDHWRVPGHVVRLCMPEKCTCAYIYTAMGFFIPASIDHIVFLTNH
jgi:hypothetical protein